MRSLYHSRAKLTELRDQLFQDLQCRIPSFSSSFALTAPVFSTIDGKAVRFSDSSTLKYICEFILDLILLEPVDWPAVQASIVSITSQATASANVSCEILNFGPGYGMSKSKTTLPKNVRIVDVSSTKFDPSIQSTSAGFARDDIAIVGMGVDLPSAPNVASLWENLIGGVNSCSEVSKCHHYKYYPSQSDCGKQ